jgi:hypothetical protein
MYDPDDQQTTTRQTIVVDVCNFLPPLSKQWRNQMIHNHGLERKGERGPEEEEEEKKKKKNGKRLV